MVFIRNCRQEKDQISSATKSAEINGPEMNGPELNGPEINEPEINGPEVNGWPTLPIAAPTTQPQIPIPPPLPDDDAFENVECSPKIREVECPRLWQITMIS